MIISVNDHPAMREVFDGLHVDTIDIHYTVGGAGAGKGKDAQELILWNDNCDRRPKMDQTQTIPLF